MQRFSIILLLFLLAAPAPAMSEIVTKDVEYEHDGEKLVGFLAYDDSRKGPLPGVVVVHEWWGLNDHAKNSAKRLAEMGYAAFALDMYGEGLTADTVEKAAALSKPFLEDRKYMCARAGEGLSAFRSTGMADPGNIAAIGYCFGGTTVLEMARGLLPLAGVVSFHGGLDTPDKAKTLACPVLALHGAEDPLVDSSEAKAFRKEMRDAGVDWQMVYFGGAVHSFTNPAAGNDPSKGTAYNKDAARRSWMYMELFLDEVLDR